MATEVLENEQVEKDQKRKKKKDAKYTPFIVAGLLVFFVVVIFYWRNSKEKQVVEEIDNNVIPNAATDQPTVDAAESERLSYWDNLNREKQSLMAQLNANFEEAKKNKELFLQINQETDEESIEASFLLKDDKDNQRVKIVERNKKLLEEKNRMLDRLRQIEGVAAQFGS